MDTIKKCFVMILSGNKSDSRLAARKVRKLLHNSQNRQTKYKDIVNIINNAPSEYAKISEEWRQENFVVAISVIYFLHNKEDQPDFLFPWLFHLLQHPNGIIRHASVRMFSCELGPLTVYIRCPEHKKGDFGKRTTEQADTILHFLFINLTSLLEILWQPKYKSKKYKYIKFLPTSPYKSVQMVFAHFQESCGQKYIDDLEQKIAPY
ncbi:hypothetical protein KJ973_01150 [Patescibacteria group bacterium]|nr:hypothetical protein [Patescibacteria group bacterium]MBU1246372.1 hypothetical protein [Patescibacteria group bacterium]MBU1519288.1 hypothetical protein [Patescibacteria group bacterium]MBU1730323.1 hypothetical protein [Patescibacteria group bacterium]MBU1956208.1 hypothetical protein [Patescibacteria group bacterium]